MNQGNNDKQAYDRGVSMFSPDGRLYQVEYAREAVRRGSPSVGVRCSDGVLFGAYVNGRSSLMVDESIDKMHRISNSLGVVTAGHVSDGRKLVDKARVTAQKEELAYGEMPAVRTLTNRMAGYIQESTQVGGRRPFGASLVIGGVDDTGPHVYEVEPGGTPNEWEAVAVGNNRDEFMTLFENNYDSNATVEDNIQLVVSVYRTVMVDEFNTQNLRLAVIEGGEENCDYYEVPEDKIEEEFDTLEDS